MIISSSQLKKLKKVELGILIEFDKVCKQLGINYTICAGTLLGAIRHKGFIPWDDDIDVSMTRQDYNKFINEGQRLMPDCLFIQTYETDKNYPHNFAKVLDLRTNLKEIITRNIDMKNGVYMDIFPIDRISSNLTRRKLDNFLISLIYFIKQSSNIEWIKKNKNYFKRAIKYFVYPIGKSIGTRRLNRLETYIKVKNNKANNSHTYGDNYLFPLLGLNNLETIPIDIYEDLEEIEFEQHKFKAMKQWDIYLRVLYGDYMQLPPEDKRKPSHGYIDLQLED